MQNIDTLRGEIDRIQTELVGLFRQRLTLTRKIWDLKKEQKLPLLDARREEILIHQFDSLISDDSEREAVQQFVRAILVANKSHLEGKLK